MESLPKSEQKPRVPLEAGKRRRVDLGPVGATAVVAAFAAVAVAMFLAVVIPGIVERHLLDAEANSIQDTVREIASSLDSDSDLTEVDLSRLQTEVDRSLLGRGVVRVKIWDDAGTVLFSDEDRLIGGTYEMSADLVAAFNGDLIYEEPDLTRPENLYEQGFGELREYYVPVDGGEQGIESVFEVYELADKLVDTVTEIRNAV